MKKLGLRLHFSHAVRPEFSNNGKTTDHEHVNMDLDVVMHVIVDMVGLGRSKLRQIKAVEATALQKRSLRVRELACALCRGNLLPRRPARKKVQLLTAGY